MPSIVVLPLVEQQQLIAKQKKKNKNVSVETVHKKMRIGDQLARIILISVSFFFFS